MSNKVRSGQVSTNTTNFDNILSPTEDDVQKALDVIDDHIHGETRGGTGNYSYNTGNILYASAPDTLTTLPIGPLASVLTSNGATPYWAALDTEDAIDIIRVGKIDIIAPNTTVYLLPDFSESNNEDFIAYLIDGDGMLLNLYITAGTACGMGESIVFTVRCNGLDTPITTTLSDANTTASDIANMIFVFPGDLITIKAVTSAGCAASDIYVSLRYSESLINSDTIDIITAGKIGAVTAGVTRYLLPNYSQGTSEVFPAYMVPEDGYVDHLRIYANTPPGVGDNAIITLRNGGVDTLLTATITDLNNTASDLVNIIDVNSGDKLTISIITSAGCVIEDVFVSMRYSS